MKIVVLKGGECAAADRVDMRDRSTRTPGSVAVSGDDGPWAVINISPAVAEQLVTDAGLRRLPGLSVPNVRTVVLTDAQVDHVTGLLSLRDGPPIHLYATPAVYEELCHTLPVLPMLQHYCDVMWHVIPVAGECPCAVFHVDALPTLEFTAIATQAPLPRHAQLQNGRVVGDTIALAVRDRRSGQRLFCAPGLDGAGAATQAWMEEADCVLIGETWSDLSPQGRDPAREARSDSAGKRHGPGAALRRHLQIDADEAVDVLAGLPARRKVLMRSATGCAGASVGGAKVAGDLAARGIELAADRMQIDL